MDTITHGLSGVLLAKTGFHQRYGRTAMALFVISAILPDIDNLLWFWGDFAYLKYHRGITHSLLGALILSLFLALIFYFLTSLKRYWLLVGASLIGLITHIFFDLITSYGTQVFYPFSSIRYSLDLIFIIDLAFTSIILLPLILGRFMKKGTQAVAMTGVLLLIIYIGIAAVNRSIALEKAREELAQRGNILRVDALPQPISFFRWSVIAETEDSYLYSPVNILDGSLPEFKVYSKGENNTYIDRTHNLEEVKLYKWFARFPVVTHKAIKELHIVEYFDLRFNSVPGRRPFLLKIVMDDNGRVIEKVLTH